MPHVGSAGIRTGCACGANDGARRASPSRSARGGGASRLFPPLDLATVKAVACESPRQHGQAAARWSLAALVGAVRTLSGKLAAISRSTVQRVLVADAIKPWQFRSWLFPRDPQFADKAARVLDLYEGIWEGKPLGPDEHVISADEETSIQARALRHASLPAGPQRPARVEHEYRRTGALQYLAALDVRLGVIFGRCEAKSGKAAFARLVEQVMSLEPYRSAPRVFWIVDNGSSHRGAKAAAARQQLHPNLVLVHPPVHACWLNRATADL